MKSDWGTMFERNSEHPLGAESGGCPGAPRSNEDDVDRSELDAGTSLRRLVDNLGVGVFSIDNRTGRVIEANPAYARILGFASVEDAIGSSVFEHYEDPKERAETVARFLASREIRESGMIRFEAVRVRRDTRSPVPVLMTVSVVRDAQGDVTRLDGIIEDISERKRVEKAFDIGERRFRLLFERAALGMVITSSDRVVTRVNNAFCAFVGCQEDELPGKLLDQLVHPDDRHLCSLVTPLSEGAERLGPRSQEWRFIDKSGGTVWGVVTVTWIRSEDGEPLSAVLMVQDVTSRKRMEEDLVRAEKLESLGLLAGGIAHEFNNVLAVILGNVSLAEMMTEGNESLAEALEQASAATHRARALTSKLMTFAKGGHPMKCVTSVEELLRRSASLCLRGTGVIPRFDVHQDLAHAELDVAQMDQVFTNLIANAQQAMPHGGQVIVAARNVTLGADSCLPLPPGRYVQVDISDEGVGIPPENLAHVFDPFFKWDAGLGLAIAHSVVKRHGGHISVHSELGVGSTFSVYLAATDADETAASEVRPPTAIARSGRILVMDDEPEVQRVAAAMLRACGIEADLVSDGATAVTTFAAAAEAGRPYAAVILDLTVPGGLGGAEIIGRLREIDPKIRAIVSSGYSVSPVIAEYRHHGFTGVLPKPYTIADLRSALQEVLGQGGPS
jgi:PAS domain S-box-containing protein